MVVLDTHVCIWLIDGATIAPQAHSAINLARANGTVHISAITAWEIGMLASKGRIKLHLPPLAWFTALAAEPGVQIAPMTPEIAIQSSYLPGSIHKDPADRIIAATAMALGCPLVTRDSMLLTYAQAGHLKAIAC